MLQQDKQLASKIRSSMETELVEKSQTIRRLIKAEKDLRNSVEGL